MRGLRSRPAPIALTLAFVLATTGLIAIFFATPVQAHSSTVTVLDGSVFVRHGGGQFAPISDGDVVAGGDTIRTAAESHGVLTFFDGTTVELEPQTEITVATLEASAAGDKIVDITQAIGRTWHVVTHLASPTSQYEIRTPTSTAIVRGTAFEVDVAADGTTAAATTDGDVAVTAQGTEVHVLAGQFTTVPRGAPPAPAQPSPVPDVTVQMTLDLVSTAIVTDRNGRAVGVLKGQPVRYIPGSTVRVVDGKLVITIPNAQLGVLTTYVQPDPAPGGAVPADVTIQTQVFVRGVGIVTSLVRQPVENGAAKGAVVVMDSGLLLVPDSDARNAPPPHIGKPPAGPTAILGMRTAPTQAPLVTVAPATATPTPTVAPLTGTGSTVQPLAVTTAAFVPYQTTTTTTAPVANTGLVTLTIDPIFTTTSTTLASATPVPVVTLPPSLITTTTIGAFATPTPAPLPSIIVIAPALTPFPIATPTPVPTIGFVPRPDLLIPTVPPASVAPTQPPVPTVPPLLTIPPTPVPTRTPISIVTAPPILFASPTPTPQPVFTIAPNIILEPTLAPVILFAPTPTPTPTPPPIRRICIDPLLGC